MLRKIVNFGVLLALALTIAQTSPGRALSNHGVVSEASAAVLPLPPATLHKDYESYYRLEEDLDDNNQITVNGSKYEFTEAEDVTENGKTVVRASFELVR